MSNEIPDTAVLSVGKFGYIWPEPCLDPMCHPNADRQHWRYGVKHIVNDSETLVYASPLAARTREEAEIAVRAIW